MHLLLLLLLLPCGGNDCVADIVWTCDLQHPARSCLPRSALK